MIKHTQKKATTKKSQFNSHELAYNHWIIIIEGELYFFMACCAAWSMRKRIYVQRNNKLAMLTFAHHFLPCTIAQIPSHSWLITFIMANNKFNENLDVKETRNFSSYFFLRSLKINLRLSIFIFSFRNLFHIVFFLPHFFLHLKNRERRTRKHTQRVSVYLIMITQFQ